MTSENIHKVPLERVLRTVKEMLQDRGGFDDTVEHLERIMGDELKDIEIVKKILTVDLPRVRIVFYFDEKLKEVQKLIKDTVEGTEFALYLFVFKMPRKELMNANVKALEELTDETRSVQVFDVQELSANISRHVLVPKHEVFPDVKIPQLLQDLAIQHSHQLPAILKTDPMARYLNVKPGQIVKITRGSPTGGEYVLYRHCV